MQFQCCLKINMQKHSDVYYVPSKFTGPFFVQFNSTHFP